MKHRNQITAATKNFAINTYSLRAVIKLCDLSQNATSGHHEKSRVMKASAISAYSSQ